MEFRKISDTEAELHQTPTPTYFLESWTRFKLAEPHAIDFRFRFKPHQHAFRHGYIGMFWASYIEAPENKSIYFRNGKGWVQFNTQFHNDQSSVRQLDDALDLKSTPSDHPTLYRNVSKIRYSDAFYYGHVDGHVLAFFFDRGGGLIRFAHSPSSGGPPEFPNPAWDFQHILPAYEAMKEYSFRLRLVYREKCPREELLKEYETWRDSLSR
jgi:hypothetical protein